MNVYSIGHSNHKLERFLSLLKAHNIEVLADVRTFPGSRKYPHFNQEEMVVSLPANGIEYVHFPSLGGRRRSVRDDSPNAGLEHPAFRSYADWMDADEFRQGVNDLLDLARDKRVATMCSEGWWVKCHRRLLSDYIQALRQVPVLHIASRIRAEPHTLTAGAKVCGLDLTYPG